MRTRPKITSIEIVQYELALQDVAPELGRLNRPIFLDRFLGLKNLL